MDMLSATKLNLFDPSWPITSRENVNTPQYIGKNARVELSAVTGGCEIDGVVECSVLSPNVIIEEGAEVRYSVILPGAVIKSGAVIEYAIIGENTVINSGAHVGAAPDGTDSWGIATCGPDIEIRSGAVVPPHAMIYTGEEV